MSRLLFSTLKGNGYYIPHANSQGLNLKIGNQKSFKHREKAEMTSARYATAWLDHGFNPTNADYEYAIMVEKPLYYLQVM